MTTTTTASNDLIKGFLEDLAEDIFSQCTHDDGLADSIRVDVSAFDTIPTFYSGPMAVIESRDEFETHNRYPLVAIKLESYDAKRRVAVYEIEEI